MDSPNDLQAVKLTTVARILGLEPSLLKTWANKGIIQTVQLGFGTIHLVKIEEVKRIAAKLDLEPKWEHAI
jgi:predicted site-specific integrase-resolvase